MNSYFQFALLMLPTIILIGLATATLATPHQAAPASCPLPHAQQR
jgi:hypothetical protein